MGVRYELAKCPYHATPPWPVSTMSEARSIRDLAYAISPRIVMEVASAISMGHTRPCCPAGRFAQELMGAAFREMSDAWC